MKSQKSKSPNRLAFGQHSMMQGDLRGAFRLGNLGMILNVGSERPFEQQRFAATTATGFRTRGLVEYLLSDDQRISFDLGVTSGHGPVSAEVIRLDVAHGLQTLKLAYDSTSLRLWGIYTRMNMDLKNHFVSLDKNNILETVTPIDTNGQVLELHLHMIGGWEIF